MELLKVASLFAITAVAEIVGCYLPWLVLKQGRATWLLFPAALSLALFAWLLTLHPTAAGRTYAAYGGMYIPWRSYGCTSSMASRSLVGIWWAQQPPWSGWRSSRCSRRQAHDALRFSGSVAIATGVANYNRPPLNPRQQRK